MKPAEPVAFSIAQKIPAINRYQGDEDFNNHAVGAAAEGGATIGNVASAAIKQLDKRTASRKQSTLAYAKTQEIGSYMDTDFNPRKKHKFAQDTYLKHKDLFPGGSSSDVGVKVTAKNTRV